MADYTGRDQRLKYLFQNGGGGGGSCKVISGYYHNGDFYEDQSYTQIITGSEDSLYIDLDTTTLYLFDGTDYVEVQGGGGSGGGLSVTEEVLQATEMTLTAWANPLSIPLVLSEYVGFGVEITWQSGSSPVSYFVTEEQINGNSYVLIPSRNSSHTHNDLYIGYSNGNLNFYVVTNQSVTIHRVTGLKKETLHTYSTTEQVVGTWIDGKPIYEKTVDCGTLANTTSTQYFNHGISDLEMVVDTQAFMTNGSAIANLPFHGTAGDGVSICIELTRIGIVTQSNRSSYKAYVTLRYTKTTD